MQNHGLVVSGDTPEEITGDLEWLSRFARAFVRG